MRTPKTKDPRPVYQVRLPLSKHTLATVTDAIRGHRAAIGSRWRKKTHYQQALIVLAHLRHDQRLADLAGGNDISASTVRRWVIEVIGLLAARMPRLERILAKAARTGSEYVLLDATLVRSTRRHGKTGRRLYSSRTWRAGKPTNQRRTSTVDGRPNPFLRPVPTVNHYANLKPPSIVDGPQWMHR